MSKDIENRRLGEVLKAIRENMELTQYDISKKLNMTVQSISHYENGKRRPSASYLTGLSEMANMSVDSIYELAKDQKIGAVGMRSRINSLLTTKDEEKSSATAALTKAMSLLESGLITAEKFDQIVDLISGSKPQEKE